MASMTRWIMHFLTGQSLVFHFDKGGGGPPPAPDPALQIAAQAKALPSVISPYGKSIYSGDPNAGTFTRTDTLSPDQQRQFEGRNKIAESLLGRSSSALGKLPVGYEFRGAEDPTTNKFFTSQRKLLDDVFSRDEERLDQKLANQGLPTGSEAYGEEFSDFRRSKADAYDKASADALQLGFSQDVATRQQNLNEVAQALGGSQLQPVGQGGNPLDTSTPYAQQQASRLAGYNADVAGRNSTNAGLFGLGAAALPLIFSDRRLKRDIIRVGELLPGVGWYAYRYLWDKADAPSRFGVMADELEVVMPEAVIYDAEGVARVDYGRLLAGRTVH